MTRGGRMISGAGVVRNEERSDRLTQFSDLGLAAPILDALAAKGYSEPTPIQADGISPILAGRDLLGIAATGTGKTAAFALPILHRLAQDRRPAPKRGCRALVLAPTRELAAQIATSFRGYGEKLGTRVAVVVGGVSMRPQVTALLRGVDVLVATPGRLIDHMEQKTVTLSGVETLVLDEADHMLDLGFIPAIRRLVKNLPSERQTLFFSATMPSEINRLADEFLSSPARVSVTPPATTAERVDQSVIFTTGSEKPQQLQQILRAHRGGQVLVFTRTKRGADKLVRNLGQVNIDAAAIHGNKSQGQRDRALGAFRSGKAPILIATDIAARGIDVSGISLVINYDLPNVPETYVHRIGRTARAGAGGRAIAFCTPEERSELRRIEATIRQKIPSGRKGAGEDEAAAEPVSAEPARPAKAEPAKAHARGEDQARNPRRRRRRRNANGKGPANPGPAQAQSGKAGQKPRRRTGNVAKDKGVKDTGEIAQVAFINPDRASGDVPLRRKRYA